MDVSLQHNGKAYANWLAADLIATGVPANVVGAALKAHTQSLVSDMANDYRARLATASPGKLAEYRVKEEIARDPANAADAELALIDREAAARGLDRNALLAEISAKAAAYRQIALLVGALEAETKAAIRALADDAPDIEAQVQAVLATATAQAGAAFADAKAMLVG